MIKLDDLVFGNLYLVRWHGSCDYCGSPQRVDSIVQYEGIQDNQHRFSVPPFSCPGCHRIIDRYNVVADMDVTNEFKQIHH